MAQERLDRITACVSEMSVVDVPSPMVKVSSRHRMASPPRGPASEEDPNEWMDSAIPVDEVLGNTLTSQGFRIEDRPRSPSQASSPATSPRRGGPVAGVLEMGTSENAPGGAAERAPNVLGGRLESPGVRGERDIPGGASKASGEGEYRSSRLGDERLSHSEESANGAGGRGNEALRTEPSLVGMVSVDLSDGIPVEDTGIPVGAGGTGTDVDVLRRGLEEEAGHAPLIPPPIPEERPLTGSEVGTGELEQRVSSAVEDAGSHETRGAVQREEDPGGDQEAGTSGRGVAGEPGQYKSKRPPAIAVSVPAPISRPEVTQGSDQVPEATGSSLGVANGQPEGVANARQVTDGVSRPEAVTSSDGVGVPHTAGVTHAASIADHVRREGAPSSDRNVLASPSEATPSTTASARASGQHTRMESVDSAFRCASALVEDVCKSRVLIQMLVLVVCSN